MRYISEASGLIRSPRSPECSPKTECMSEGAPRSAPRRLSSGEHLSASCVCH